MPAVDTAQDGIQTADVSITLVKPYPKNSRKHPEHQLKALTSAIKRFGFTQPIIVDEELTILAGHARYEAAKRLNLEYLPCRILPNLSPEEKSAYVIADNKIADESSWDHDNLLQELGKISSLNLDEDIASILAPSSFGLSDDDLRSATDEDHQYKPILNPTQGAGLGVTDASVQREEQRLASQFNDKAEQALIQLTCPHCDETFTIEKRIAS